jgi:putative membrane protein
MNQLRRFFTLVIVLAAVILGVLFALQNKQAVPLDLLVITFAPRSLALWLLVFFALGGLAGLVVSSLYMLRLRTALGSARRRLARALAELDQLPTRETSPGD